jgi:thiamine pyrophosphate-dependent acetolactate synthase large subunit-like protein
MTASRRATPVLLLAGDVATTDMDSTQRMDQAAFASGIGVSSTYAGDATRAVADLDHALEALESDPGPRLLTIPVDIQQAEMGAVLPRRERGRTTDDTPDPADVDRAVAAIERAERPAILAGRGAMEDGASRAIEKLADVLGAPIFTTLPARTMFGESSTRVAGFTGNFLSRAAESIIRKADLIVVVGASLSRHTTSGWKLFPDARLVRIDRRPALDPRPQLQHAIHVQGGARRGTEAIAAGVSGRAARPRQEWSSDPGPVERPPAEPAVLGDGLLHPGYVARLVDGAIPADGTVMIGVGHFFSFVIEQVRVAQRTFLFTHDFGAIGQCLPMAIGASAGTGQRTFVVEGDASLMLALPELDVLGRYRLPVTTIVMNDQAVGAEYHKLRSIGLDPESALLATPDLAAIADVCGVRSARVSTPDELRDALAAASDTDGPFLIDVQISRDVVSAPYRRQHFREEVAATGARP